MITLLLINGCHGVDASSKSKSFSRLRENMVSTQIEARGIRNPNVLRAMKKVLRHEFVPEEYASQAYEDKPLPIGSKQTISQPYIVALMTESIHPNSSMKVLEIGTGSGYQAAVLAEIVQEVYTIEIVPTLAHRAVNTIFRLGYKNIFLKEGDGYAGWKEKEPFDAVLVTCSPDHVPQPLVDQLKPGGIIIIPVGKLATGQNLILLQKKNGQLIQKKLIPVHFVPMTGKALKVGLAPKQPLFPEEPKGP